MKKSVLGFLFGSLIACTSITLGCASQSVDLLDEYKRMLNSNIEVDTLALKTNFENKPEQYSQEMGDYLLKQFYKKNSVLGRELIKLPDLRDGISHAEVIALQKIYHMVEPLDIPEGFMQQKEDQYIHHIKIEWSSTESNDWSARIQSGGNSIHSVKTISFEPGDTINQAALEQRQSLLWYSKIGNGDNKDGIIIYIEYPMNKIFALTFEHLEAFVYFKFSDLVQKRSLLFGQDYGLNGTMTVDYLYGTKTWKQIDTEMANSGIRNLLRNGSSNIYNSGLEALLWGVMDGKLNDTQLSNYSNMVDYIRPIWGEMEGPRWDRFSVVIDRLNKPELVNYWTMNNLNYEYYLGDQKMDGSVFKYKRANCVDTTQFILRCLRNAGYPAGDLWVDSRAFPGHVICYYKDNGNIYVIDNGTRNQSGILGPYKSLNEIPFKIIERRNK